MGIFNRKKENGSIITKCSREALCEYEAKERMRSQSKICPECGTIEEGFGCGVDGYGYSHHKCSNSKCRCEWKFRG